MSDEVGTYLGQKGYSIYKECLSIEEQHWLREQLLVRPNIPNSPVKAPSFPVYRESPNKIYIPRFFGIETYGQPEESRISDGENINIEFNGILRDYQQTVVDTYVKTVGDDGGGGLLELPCGFGKTIIALNIIGTLKLKTLVIVHKSFLMNFAQDVRSKLQLYMVGPQKRRPNPSRFVLALYYIRFSNFIW